MPDSLRLALGTFTALRVPAPRRVDRSVARGAMLWAPVVGLLLALVVAVAVVAVRTVFGEDPAAILDVAANRGWVLHAVGTDLLAAVVAVVLLALLTRGLHLDGLADTADAWGLRPGAGAPERLDVMKRPDVGAMGVAAVVLVVLVQVSALGLAILTGHGTDAILTAVVTGRLAATWCACHGVPAARSEGLGAMVAGSVPRAAALAATVAVLVLAVVAGLLDDDVSRRLVVSLPLAVLVGLAVCALVVRWAVRRLGGVTGDVMGAAVELTTAAVLVVVALVA